MRIHLSIVDDDLGGIGHHVELPLCIRFFRLISLLSKRCKRSGMYPPDVWFDHRRLSRRREIDLYTRQAFHRYILGNRN